MLRVWASPGGAGDHQDLSRTLFDQRWDHRLEEVVGGVEASVDDLLHLLDGRVDE